MKPTKNRRAGRPTVHESPFAKWIQRKGIPRDTVASALEITKQYLDKLCRGAQGPGADLVDRIVEYTNGEVTVADLRRHAARKPSSHPRKK